MSQPDKSSGAKQALSTAQHYLVSKSRDGSWPYQEGMQPSIEASAWCAMAVRHDAVQVNRSIKYLLSNQNSDGGWSTGEAALPSDWTSSLALLALRVLSVGTPPPQQKQVFTTKREQAVRFLIDDKTEFFKSPLARAIVGLIRPDLLGFPQGWPWTPDTFHWVEPTSYALLALKPLPANNDLQQAIARADQYLLTKTCKEGGWNHGAFRTFGVDAQAYPVTTAQALCALQDHPDAPQVLSALQYLRSLAPQPDTVMSLSWSILARDLHGDDTSALRSSLLTKQRPDGSFGDNLLTALACCALDTQSNVLRFPKTNARS